MSNKITFTQEHEGGKVSVETHEIFLGDIVNEFKGFLLASGFHINSIDQYIFNEETHVLLTNKEYSDLEEGRGHPLLVEDLTDKELGD